MRLNLNIIFNNTPNAFSSCDLDVETNTHFFLYCPLFSNQRWTLLSRVNDISDSLASTNDLILTNILLFGKVSLDISANTLTLNAIMNYIISKNRFEVSLFLISCNFLLYFHLFNFFPYPCVFFETINSYSFSS